MKNLKAFLTVQEAAEILGVSSKTLRRWDAAKKLTPTRHPINGYRLYDKDGLISLLRQVNVSKIYRRKSDERENISQNV